MSKDQEIVWPPVVVLENLGIGRSEGLGNKEIRSAIDAMVTVDVRRTFVLYNKGGHTGRALVLFPSSDLGYMDAMTLHQAFKNTRRGREELKLETEKRDQDGKNVIFGYLATPEDMQRLDGQKKNVKRWSVENFNEKVQKPQLDRQREAEENEKAHVELRKAVDEKARKLESNEQAVQKLARELAIASETLRVEQNRQEEARRQHEEEKHRRRMAFAAEMKARREAFSDKERELRAQIHKNRLEAEAQIERLKQETRALQGHVALQKEKERELKMKEVTFQLQLNRGVRAEEVLTQIKNKHEERVAEYTRRHQEQLKELKEKHLEKTKQLVNTYEREQKNLDGEIKDIKAAEIECEDEALREGECTICMEPFAKYKPRALYAVCGHGSVCLPCANENWETEVKDFEKSTRYDKVLIHTCPICKTPQDFKPERMPRKMFY